MSFDPARRAFLRGGNRVSTDIRPPWSVAEPRFVELCDRCDRCLPACPARILARGDGGYPAIAFGRGGCDFCGDCATACPTGAIMRHGGAPWGLVAEVGGNCLLGKGVECRSCGDSCEPRAIRFRPVPGGRVRLDLDADACTGCGACVRPCPTGAITVSPRAQERPCA